MRDIKDIPATGPFVNWKPDLLSESRQFAEYGRFEDRTYSLATLHVKGGQVHDHRGYVTVEVTVCLPGPFGGITTRTTFPFDGEKDVAIAHAQKWCDGAADYLRIITARSIDEMGARLVATGKTSL